MKSASLNDIRKELRHMDPDTIREMCMRLAKYRKENKELLNYLLFEAHNEQAYIENVKSDVAEQFRTLPDGHVYYIKKTLRKILRYVNKQIRYSAIKQTELELRIYFCMKIKEARVPMNPGSVLYNLYHQQIKKIKTILEKLPEDLQADYQSDFISIWG